MSKINKLFIVLAVISAACLLLLRYISTHRNPPAWRATAGKDLPHGSEPVPPPTTKSASGMRGRRGIIREIYDHVLVIMPTDAQARADEILTVKLLPVTGYVLVTIPQTPSMSGEAVTRSSAALDDMTLDDDVFIISFQDITASTSFSALRIEKIVTP